MRFMPTRAIEEHHTMLSWELGGGVCQEHRHHFGVYPGQDHGSHLPIVWTHRHIGIHILADDLAADGRPQWERCPAASSIADPAKPPFVLEQDAQGCPRRKVVGYGLERFWEFFLKVAAMAGSCFV